MPAELQDTPGPTPEADHEHTDQPLPEVSSFGVIHSYRECVQFAGSYS